ncbi:MAG: iron-containing alcohol dehydrogenase [Lentisphaerae bacterium]|jgi:alcohol dehydrogenase class IV|nr:iron-containing alcohol dehydrogenase [Lentisphaerota bacterium]
MNALDLYGANFPGRILFGSGVRNQVPGLVNELLAGQQPRVMAVCSKSVLKTKPGKELIDALKGKIVKTFTDVPHDPPVQCVDQIIAEIREGDANLVVALGGGSVMDAAKSAAILACAEGKTADFLNGKLPMPNATIPVIALPTTAGTGSEVTKNTVLSDHDANVKKSLRSPLLVPKAAVVDPDFTQGLSFTISRDSGLDALTQAIESFISLGANRLTRGLAREAIVLLMAHLESACTTDVNITRVRVAEGSLIGGLAFGQSGLGAVHGLAHPIGHTLGTTHGLTCAILLPHILKWNLPAAKEEYQELAQTVGAGNMPEDFLTAVQKLCQILEVPETFKSYNLKQEHFDYIIKNCRSGSMKANPRPMSDDDVKQLLNSLL